MREGVERFLREKAASTLLGMKRLGGGASQELWAVDAEIPGEGKKSLVLRTTAGGGFLSGIGREDEWRLLSLAYEAGVPS